MKHEHTSAICMYSALSLQLHAAWLHDGCAVPDLTCVMLCDAAKSCEPMTTLTGCVMKCAASCWTPVGQVALNIMVCRSERTCGHGCKQRRGWSCSELAQCCKSTDAFACSTQIKAWKGMSAGTVIVRLNTCGRMEYQKILLECEQSNA